MACVMLKHTELEFSDTSTGTVKAKRTLLIANAKNYASRNHQPKSRKWDRALKIDPVDQFSEEPGCRGG